jgi:hypothetical protein
MRPRIAMKRRDMSLKIPDFGTSQVRWSFKIPHFKVRDPIKIPTETGDLNLRKMLSDVTESRAKALQAVER